MLMYVCTPACVSEFMHVCVCVCMCLRMLLCVLFMKAENWSVRRQALKGFKKRAKMLLRN